jgi:uncharacterized protein YjgD (DUF1641 family)
MAKPITLQMPPRDAHAELVEKLESAPVTHAAAILEWYELLQALHDSGLMSTLRGAVGEGGEIVKAVSEGLNKPESIRAIRNLMVLAKLAGEIDPEIFRRVVAAVPDTLRDANFRREQMKTPGPWRQFRSFAGFRAWWRALNVVAAAMNASGRALESKPKRKE